MTDSSTWRTCRTCGTTKTLVEFYGDSGHRVRHHCRECERKKMAQLYAANKVFIQEYKLSRGCTDCGYNAHPEALEFDHLPEFVKKFNISANISRPREQLEREIAKCEVVCANCHRVRTKDRGKTGAWWDLKAKGLPVPGAEPAPFEQLVFDLGA